MKLLLDTHIWIWSLLDPARLGRGIKRRLEDGANELWISPISLWETMLLVERGRIELDQPPSDWIDRQLIRVPLRDAPLTRAVAVKSRELTLIHEDPADRFLAATAAVYELTLVTADMRLWGGAGYQVLRSR
ncbi:MAG: type II toxin-antitoxin system VapC family toxin [Acidimicrobiia bacterium]